jgi:hypothetical protein
MKRSFNYLLAATVLLGSSTTVHAFGVYPKEVRLETVLPDTGSRMQIEETANFSAPILLHGSLVTFNGAYGKNFYDLNWNTLPDSHYDHFEIERSMDGFHYEKLAEIKGNESHAENYSYRDRLHPYVARGADLYYRLKQVEENGHVSYSKVLIARIYHSRSIQALSVTPDPVVNDLLVNVQLKENSFIMMKVKDQDGNELLKEGVSADNGPHTYTLEGTSNLKPGTYMLEVIVNSRESMVMKLLKS